MQARNEQQAKAKAAAKAKAVAEKRARQKQENRAAGIDLKNLKMCKVHLSDIKLVQ